MAVRKLDAATWTPAAQLHDWGVVGAPITQPPCALRGDKMVLPLPGAPEAGIWECSPGRYQRQIRSAEAMVVLSGEATFAPLEGDSITLRQGDVWFFDSGTLGEWHILQPLRKFYLVFTPG